MNAFIVSGQDRPGEMARVAEAIAERGVNITNITCVAWGGQGAIALLTNDEPATRSLLSAKGFPYREVELVACTLEDKPGTLAEAMRKLADAGVNIEACMPTGMSGNKVSIALATSDPAKARETLGTGAVAHA